jgi:hypothetical protein
MERLDRETQPLIHSAWRTHAMRRWNQIEGVLRQPLCGRLVPDLMSWSQNRGARASLLSIQLSIETGIIRHREG